MKGFQQMETSHVLLALIIIFLLISNAKIKGKFAIEIKNRKKISKWLAWLVASIVMALIEIFL